MKKRDIPYVIAAIIVVILGFIFMAYTIHELIEVRNIVEESASTQYDLDCLTLPIENPLIECREE